MEGVNKKLNLIFKTNTIRRPNSFSKNLIDWYSIVKRDLPWRKTHDPYKIWLSEIILQQTRVDQGLPYYIRFTTQYPTIQDLANAAPQEVMKTWEGLGYYSRARNLHFTAKHISHEFNGEFPDKYADLLKLKGVGPYTAAAIASIAFNEPTPVIDGNVFRFVARYFGVEKEITDTKNRKFFLEILEELIPNDQPADFNQAIMEFGATVCKPAPLCMQCDFRGSCFAYANKLQSSLPVKKQKAKSKELIINYFILESEGTVLMRERNESIWHGLFEFYGTENKDSFETIKEMQSKHKSVELIESFGPIKHLLTHRKLWVSFHHVNIQHEASFNQLSKELDMKPYSWQEILTLPLPKVIVNHLEQVDF